jgi:hypothetical protein
MKPQRHNKPATIATAALLIALLACNAPLGAQPAGGSAPDILGPTSTPLRYEGEIDMLPGEMDALPESLPEPWELTTAVNWPLLTANVGPEGGTLTVEQTGSPLDGFSITIPPDAYGQTVTFEISAAEITGHNIPADLTVITPLIVVENGGVEASEFLELHLPRSIAEGRFAMLFTYDPVTRALDALPLIEHGSQGLTALTTHFSNLLGVEVNTADLDALNIQTGFKHGRNSWQFTNYGSFIEPRGNCAGMTVTAMDYFLRHGGTPLFGKYNNFGNPGYPPTANQENDDRLAQRLVSVAQVGIDWDAKSIRYWYKLQRKYPGTWLTYYMFALALRASHEPQMVAIYDGTSGHAMIVYGKYADRFYISDPNYPKADANRYLSFDRPAGKFRTYYSGPNAADLGNAYPFIHYMNKYYVIDPAAAALLWAQLDAGTIGNSWFPEYKLFRVKVHSDLTAARLEIFASDIFVDGPEAEIEIESATPLRTTVYDQANRQVKEFYSTGPQALPVSNPLGTPYLLAIYGQIGSEWRWIDGRWITLYRGISGTWHGAACAESESNPYRWEIKLDQGVEGDVIGDMYFHACPGGGAVFYSVSGTQESGKDHVVLTANYAGGRGDLGSSAPQQTMFTVKLKKPPSPNLAP